jgi:cell division protein FtsA
VGDGHTRLALDIGTSKVCALVVADDGPGPGRMLGAGVAPAAGVRKGMIVGVEEVVQAVRLAVRRAERIAQCAATTSAVVAVAGAHLASLNSRGMAALQAAGQAVEHDDVLRAVESARAVLLPPDHEVIHVLPRGFAVDGQRGIRNPVGMVGRRLDAEVHIVAGEVTPLRNLEQCLRRAGLAPLALVSQGLAAAEAVLSSEEKELGVALIDLGAGTCDLVVFQDGAPVHTTVLPVGGNNVTRDIAIGLRIPLDVAEELKLSYACAAVRSTGKDEFLSARTFGGTIVEVSRRQLCTIVAARVDEILELLRAEIQRAGGSRLLPAGYVFTGGAAALDGFLDRAAEMLDGPVRLGQPLFPYGVAGTIDGPAYAVVAGLARWRCFDTFDADALPQRRARAAAVGRTAVATLSPVAQRVAGWLRAFLP